MSLLQHLPPRARVCIIRLRAMSECILTTPAIELVKTMRPDLEIGVVVDAPFRALFDDHPAITQCVEPNWRAVRAWGARVCVNMHGGTRSQWMTALSGAAYRAGFGHHNVTLAYNVRIGRGQRILAVNRLLHAAEQYASAFLAMGVPLQDVPQATLYAPPSPLPGRYAVLHAYASTPEKRWPAAKFCEVARYLRLWNIRPVFLAAPGENTAEFRAHEVFQGSLKDVKSVISGACLFIGNDSGPAHIAAAFNVPTVVLFSTTNPAVWGPWRTESQIVVAPEGLEHVNVSRVIAALERLSSLEEAHA